MPGTDTTSITSYNFFLDATIGGGGGYVDNEHAFVNAMQGGFADGLNFVSHSIAFVNDDATNDLYFSFDGVTDHGRVRPGEYITQDFRRLKKIWFRGTVGAPFRFWAW